MKQARFDVMLRADGNATTILKGSCNDFRIGLRIQNCQEKFLEQFKDYSKRFTTIEELSATIKERFSKILTRCDSFQGFVVKQ